VAFEQNDNDVHLVRVMAVCPCLSVFCDVPFTESNTESKKVAAAKYSETQETRKTAQ